MNETLAAFLPLLRYLAAPSVVGALASIAFACLRVSLPQDTELTSPAPSTRYPALRRFGVQLRALLFTPRYARLAALLLAGIIGGALNVLIAAVSGGDVLAVADHATAGLMAMVASQLMHGMTLNAEVGNAAQA